MSPHDMEWLYVVFRYAKTNGFLHNDALVGDSEASTMQGYPCYHADVSGCLQLAIATAVDHCYKPVLILQHFPLRLCLSFSS